MNCDYKIIETNAGQNLLRCQRPSCGHETFSVYPPNLVHTMCRAVENRVGVLLHHLLLEKLGADFKNGCACKEWLVKMNEWGPEGCRENLKKITGALLREAKRRQWQLGRRPLLSKVAQVGTRLPGGMIFARAWVRRLVLQAIRRSERNEESNLGLRSDDGTQPTTRPAADDPQDSSSSGV